MRHSPTSYYCLRPVAAGTIRFCYSFDRNKANLIHVIMLGKLRIQEYQSLLFTNLFPFINAPLLGVSAVSEPKITLLTLFFLQSRIVHQGKYI